MEQRTPEWKAFRRPRITASRFGDVLAKPTTKRYRGYQEDIIDAILGVPEMPEDDKPWFHHGIAWESEGLADYEWRRFLAGDDITVETIGVIVHPKYDFISCSPDGFFVEPDAKVGVELKSRKSLKQHRRASGVLPPEHKPQVQGCLWITGWEAWEFISFYKNVELKKTLCGWVRVPPDLDYHKKLEEACIKFWEEIQEAIK